MLEVFSMSVGDSLVHVARAQSMKSTRLADMERFHQCLLLASATRHTQEKHHRTQHQALAHTLTHIRKQSARHLSLFCRPHPSKCHCQSGLSFVTGACLQPGKSSRHPRKLLHARSSTQPPSKSSAPSAANTTVQRVPLATTCGLTCVSTVTSD